MVQRASGLVTFLFTDIEGSTRLLKQLRGGYVDVLAEHQRLLRQAFGAHGGEEIDTAGDGFFVAFSSARDAVLAAVEGQMALLAHRWPEGVQLKVRMGIHTGQAVAGDGGYTGLAVHRAARIMAAAHGGQVLVSQATQTLLEDEEEDLHIFLRDLGEQRLKDLGRPVRLYQAGTDGLPEAFPPLRHEASLAEVAEHAVRPPARRRHLTLLAAGGAARARGCRRGHPPANPFRQGWARGCRPEQRRDHRPEDERDRGTGASRDQAGPVGAKGGAVWVGNLDDRNPTRIDSKRREVTGDIDLDNQTPTGIAIGAAVSGSHTACWARCPSSTRSSSGSSRRFAMSRTTRRGEVWISAAARSGLPSPTRQSHGPIRARSESPALDSRATLRPASRSGPVRCGSRTGMRRRSIASTRRSSRAARSTASPSAARRAQSTSATMPCGSPPPATATCGGSIRLRGRCARSRSATAPPVSRTGPAQSGLPTASAARCRASIRQRGTSSRQSRSATGPTGSPWGAGHVWVTVQAR